VLGARKLPFLRCTLSITHLYTFVGIYLFHIPLPGIHTCLFSTCNKKTNCLIKTQNVYTCLTVLCNCERHHRLPSFNFFSVGLPSYSVWPPTPIPRLFPFSSTRVAPIVYSDCKKCFLTFATPLFLFPLRYCYQRGWAYAISLLKSPHEHFKCVLNVCSFET
jgi:hypothetical protein